ncbi:hypothetical protein CTI12_AA092210 [Artemisia annua]|uniref:BED-type domain-containing protein n=1 Tax=Artemisia annua TaxID=35608 RepID=A0A2U1PZP3_ARTAN|nr:hypothetical protein CTI12_AA092210 [Artemisia annua]
MASGENENPELGATASSVPHDSSNRSSEDRGDENPFTKRKRASKSKVWIDMIKIDNGKRAKCIHCKECYVIPPSGTTTTLQRHISGCTEKKNADRKQQLLNFQRVSDGDQGTSSSFPALTTAEKNLDLKNLLREIHVEYARLLHRIVFCSSKYDEFV